MSRGTGEVDHREHSRSDLELRISFAGSPVRQFPGFELACPRMCRNIKTLANFDPPATEDEIHASALQFVRKLSGTARPSHANEQAFNTAVEEVTAAASRLIRSLTSSAPRRNREEETAKARERSMKRFA